MNAFKSVLISRAKPFVKSFAAAGILASMALGFNAQAENPTAHAGLLGTWTNTNANSGGIIKVVISKTSSGALRYTSYGSCSPTPCVHSTVTAYPYSASVSDNTSKGFYAYRNSGFKYERVTAQRVGSYLKLDSFSTFAAGDSRKNYISSGYFLRN